MDFKEFDKLYRGDTVSFLLAMELFLENGRDKIEASGERELSVAAASKLSGFFADHMIDGIAQTAKKLSGMKTSELLSYAARCGICVGAKSSDEPGVCPVCGGGIKYDCEGSSERSFILYWHCPDCGASGQENHHLLFDAHYDLRDKSGKPIARCDEKYKEESPK